MCVRTSEVLRFAQDNTPHFDTFAMSEDAHEAGDPLDVVPRAKRYRFHGKRAPVDETGRAVTESFVVLRLQITIGVYSCLVDFSCNGVAVVCFIYLESSLSTCIKHMFHAAFGFQFPIHIYIYMVLVVGKYVF